MEVNFIPPSPTVVSGSSFDVVVTAKHAPLGATIELRLAQTAPPLTGASLWTGTPCAAPVLAAPGAPDGTAMAVFTVTLGGKGRAFLQATAQVLPVGELDVKVDHVDVI